jgi:hypothetical protein
VSRKQLDNARESSVGMVAPAFTIKIEQDRINSGRYRWKVFVGTRQHDLSVHSFATKREALKDAEKFVAKLNSTWGTI